MVLSTFILRDWAWHQQSSLTQHQATKLPELRKLADRQLQHFLINTAFPVLIVTVITEVHSGRSNQGRHDER